MFSPGNICKKCCSHLTCTNLKIWVETTVFAMQQIGNRKRLTKAFCPWDQTNPYVYSCSFTLHKYYDQHFTIFFVSYHINVAYVTNQLTSVNQYYINHLQYTFHLIHLWLMEFPTLSTGQIHFKFKGSCVVTCNLIHI